MKKIGEIKLKIMIQVCLKLFYQFSKTINKPLWLSMARTEMDFQVLL